jgi:hypothetical protein
MNFPQYSDLGNVSSATKGSWEAHLSKLQEYYHYISGDVFEERVAGSLPDENIYMYPLQMNLCEMLAKAQADSMFGEWEDQIFKFVVKDGSTVDETSKKAIALLNDILIKSSGNSMMWEMEFNRNAFRGVPMKISPIMQYPYVKWSMPPVEAFMPVWNPEDENELLEVYVVYEISADQARLLYNHNSGSKDTVWRTEHWTKTMYESFLDGTRMAEFSGVNPWGFVPFTYIPRMRTTDWFGDALTKDIMPIQDELNARLADIGEAINYNAHPIRYGMNLPRSFNAKNYPMDPNAMWDLGKVIGNSPPPQVGILEAKASVSPGVMEYVKFIYDWGRTSSFTPPIAFGEDEGSQRSGTTLEIRMWSLVKGIRRSRSYLIEGIGRAIWMTAEILKQKSHSDISSRVVSRIQEGAIVPLLADILPKDHQAIVDEVVKLRSTTPAPAISLETAQRILSRGEGEIDRIKTEMNDKDLNPEPVETNKLQQGIQGKTVPQAKTE